MQTILKIQKQEEFDRIVFIHYKNDEIIGINWHQDCELVDYAFAKPCNALTNIFNRLKRNMPLLNDEKRINKAIDLYSDAYIFQDQDLVSIPNKQTALIQKALNYYVKMAKFNTDNKIDENDELHFELFDMQQLSAMMNYEISISIYEDDKKSFASNHGIDFPIYNY